MITFFYGPDSYRRIQKIKELTSFFREKHPQANFRIFDFAAEDGDVSSDETWKDFRSFAGQGSFFDDRKLVLLKGVLSLKDKKIEEFLKSQLLTDNPVIFISESEAPPQKFEFLLEPPAKQQEFGVLTGEKLAFFLRKEAEKRGLVFESGAERWLLDYFVESNKNSWGAVNELEKIKLAVFQNPITISNLKLVLPDFASGDAADLAQAIGTARSLKERLTVLEKLFIQGWDARHLFNILAYKAPSRVLLRLADYDVSIKSGGLDYEEAILHLIIF